MTGTKSKKSEVRRQSIMTVAHVVISDVGLRNLTLREVARRCEIHLKTLQYYFPTKNELMKAIYINLVAKYLPPLIEILARDESPLSKFNHMMDQLF